MHIFMKVVKNVFKDNLHIALLSLCLICRVLGFDLESDVDSTQAIGLVGAAAIGAGINFLAQGIGSIFGNAKRKRAMRDYLRETDKANQEYNTALQNEINANYLDRADSQAAIRRVAKANAEQAKRLAGNSIKQGLTDEAKVALANQQSEVLGNVVSDIAGQGAQYKAQMRNQLANAKHAQKKERASIKYGFNADTSYLDNVVASIGQSAGQLVNAYAMSQPATAPATNVAQPRVVTNQGNISHIPVGMQTNDLMIR